MPPTVSPTQHEPRTDPGRRKFILLVPLGILGGMFATVATAAFRFLRPISHVGGDSWSNLAPIGEGKGNRPSLQRVVTEQQIGWSVVREEHFVYLLPGSAKTVLSTVCPHEGCSVGWKDEQNVFVCPCHDSSFAPDGSRISGPSLRGLDPLPTREQDGMLQVQYLSFVNNIGDRKVVE
jgi:Rieske Fe-S protein